MPELIRNIQFEVESLFDFLVHSVLAVALEECPEFFTDLCNE